MELPTLHAAIAVSPLIRSGGDAFWKAYKRWLFQHGYTIYDSEFGEEQNLLVSSMKYYQASHPFAAFSPEIPSEGEIFRHQGFVMFARDEQQREVVIKVASNRGPEIAIHRLLMGVPELYEIDGFPCVLPPLRILPSPHDFSFVITPRWGPVPMRNRCPYWDSNILRFLALPFYPFKNVDQLLFMAHSLIKGLTFLHSHKIVHRDIQGGNFLTNFFSYDLSTSIPDFLSHLNGELGLPILYALFDFNYSLVFPKDMPIEQCRLDSRFVFHAMIYHNTPEVLQAELDYDPFAFDVACMGHLLIRHLAPLIPTVPLLAPLIDKMTTHVVSSRFTAAESLQFLEFIRSNLAQEVLKQSLPLNNETFSEDEISVPWGMLDPEFTAAWSSYRTPPIRMTVRAVRWLSSIYLGKIMVKALRKWFGPGPTKAHSYPQCIYL